MATSPPFFPVDSTGEAKANRRLREPHLLADTGTNYVRAVSLDMGVFFVDTVKVYDKITGIELKREIDFLFTEYYSSLSVIFKKDLAGTLIVTNPLVNSEIEVSYNFLGSLYKDTITNIGNTINAEASRREISNLQWDMLNKCKPILPSDYVRNIGAGIGFETIVFALERIRSTLMYGDFDTEITIGQFIDNFLMTIEDVLDSRVKNEFKEQLDEFRDSFTKELLGLDKVVNMAPVDPELARLAVVRDFLFDKNKDGYVTIKAISRFKEELYNNLVSKNKTSIGRYQGTYGLPLLTTIYALRNGDGFIIDSLNTSKVAGYDFNEVVYPDRASPEDKWAITKVTNNVQGNGGVLWGTNMTTGELYIGHLKNGIDEPEVLVWTKLYSEYDMERALDALTKHVNDEDNPHWVNKHQLLLGDVENYPLADANDLACRVPSKKYVTLKWTLAFLATYMSGLKTAEDLKNMNCDENEVIRNIKLIFAPCGPCGPCCEPNIVPVTTTTSKPPVIVDPAGQLTGWFCENNKRWDIITDGKGGTKTLEHEYGEDDADVEKDGCITLAH